VREPQSEGIPPQSLLRFSPEAGERSTIATDVPSMFPEPPRLVQIVGSTVMYVVSTCTDGTAYTWAPEQAGATQAIPNDVYAYRPALAPDGQQLAFVQIGDDSSLVVAPIGGGEPKVIATAVDLGLQVGATGPWDAGGDWSPDGAWIAVEVTSEQFKDCPN